MSENESSTCPDCGKRFTTERGWSGFCVTASDADGAGCHQTSPGDLRYLLETQPDGSMAWNEAPHFGLNVWRPGKAWRPATGSNQ
jgi:hypothetical protein